MIYLPDGEFKVSTYFSETYESLTIIGSGADTKLKFNGNNVSIDTINDLTISNCTIDRMATKSWGHMVFCSSANVGGTYTISNCIFNGDATQGIYINQDKKATFNIYDCKFTGDFGEGAITIQNNGGVDFTVNVIGCEFNNIPDTSNEICVKFAYDGWTLNADGVDVSWPADRQTVTN